MLHRIEKVGFIFLVAGLLLFLASVITLAIAPALVGAKQRPRQDMLPDRVPADFAAYYADADAYRAGLKHGRDLYIREACWHCHSQYVRPVSNEAIQYGPVSTAGEYQNSLQMPQLLGTRRVGPDLIRVGGKYSNDWHFAHLYDPRSVAPLSVMPSYRWYFEKDGETVKPKRGAIDLVAYLQWLGSWIGQDSSEYPPGGAS